MSTWWTGSDSCPYGWSIMGFVIQGVNLEAIKLLDFFPDLSIRLTLTVNLLCFLSAWAWKFTFTQQSSLVLLYHCFGWILRWKCFFLRGKQGCQRLHHAMMLYFLSLATRDCLHFRNVLILYLTKLFINATTQVRVIFFDIALLIQIINQFSIMLHNSGAFSKIIPIVKFDTRS